MVATAQFTTFLTREKYTPWSLVTCTLCKSEVAREAKGSAYTISMESLKGKNN
jgi:hypothetical protein